MIISVAHDKGGTGKTTISTNIICHLSKDHDVTVIDLDPKPHLSKFLSRRADPRIKQVSCKSKEDLVKIIKGNKGVLIADVGGFDAGLTRYMLAYSDLIVTPVEDSPVEIDGLMMFKEVLRDLQKARPDLRATVLLNKVRVGNVKSPQQLRSFIGKQPDTFNMFDTIVHNRVAFKNAYGAAQSVYENGSDANASKELYLLIEEIKQWQN